MKTLAVPGHRNIVHVVGCCLQQFPLMIVTEHLPRGDLKGFLVANRQSFSNQIAEMELTTKHLSSFATDIARGMEYMASLNWVHRGENITNVFTMSRI